MSSGPYKCAFCAHESKTKSVLMMHIKTKHPAEYEASGGTDAAPASAVRTEEKSSSWAEEVDLQDLELTTRPVPGQGNQGNKGTQAKSSQQGNQAAPRGNQGGQGQSAPRGNQGNQGAPRGNQGNQGNQVNQIAEKMVSVELAEKKPKPSLLHGTQEIRVKYSAQVANMELYTATKTFEELNLPEAVLKGIYAMKFDRPSKIQETVLPLVIRPDPNGKYNNLIAQSQSGTGKTAAFALAMLTRVNPAVKKPQALCITNVRELANQVSEEIRLMAKFTEIQVFTAIGGSKGSVEGHIVVGTPGTLLTLGDRRQLNFGLIKIFVLDEADFLLDAQNMREQTVSLLKALNPDCQLLLFSATFSEEVRAFAQQYVPNATEISLKREELNVEAIGQYFVMCNDLKEKYQVLLDFASLIRVGSAIVFCETKDAAWYIADAMHKSGYEVALLTGDHKATERDEIMKHFRELKTRILITTNVISRGIDIAQVNVVINFDLPVHIPGRAPDFETYLHRIGRTGRFGKTGTAVNLVDQSSWKVMKEFEAYFGAKINELPKHFDDLAAAVEEIKL